MKGKATNRHVFLRIVREVEMSRDWFRNVLSLISTSLRCSRKRSPNLRTVSPMYNFFCIGTGNTIDEIGGNAREMISDGNSSLRSGDFVRVGAESTSPTSYARTFECAGLIIRFQCTLN